jgi:hypothetical protein
MAVVSVTLTVAAAFVVYTHVRCPSCQSTVMAIPGAIHFELRIVATNADRSGKGRVVSCYKRNCRQMVEVIEHE